MIYLSCPHPRPASSTHIRLSFWNFFFRRSEIMPGKVWDLDLLILIGRTYNWCINARQVIKSDIGRNSRRC